jgi:hypothetical protein
MPDFNPFGQLAEVQRYKTNLAMKQDQIARQNALQMQQLNRQARLEENAIARAMQEQEAGQQRQMGLEMTLGNVPPERRQEELVKRGYLQEAGQLQKATGTGGASPSNVREWEFYKALPAADQARFLAMKRAGRPMNLGSEIVFPSQVDPSQPPVARFAKDIAPEKTPEHISKTEETKVKSKALATTKTELADLEAGLPALEGVTKKLSALGKEATYTKAGQMRDIAARQAGLPTKSSVARAEYIATVNNEVLPLLRQTFGAAFTAQEGESLKITLGDPNASPAEKDAQLKAFINSKKRQIETKKRRINPPKPVTVGRFTVEVVE